MELEGCGNGEDPGVHGENYDLSILYEKKYFQ